MVTIIRKVHSGQEIISKYTLFLHSMLEITEFVRNYEVLLKEEQSEGHEHVW